MEIENKTFSVKWNRQTFNIQTSKINIFGVKEELQNLTNVSVVRQKLLFKGKILNNEDSLSIIPDGSQLTLLGNAESEVITNSNNSKVVFMEDLSKEDKLRLLKEKGEDLLYGLKNLGNTCYFNSLIQTCGRVEPLRKSLIELSKNQGNINNYNLSRIFCFELGKVYYNLENTTDPVVPMKLVQQLRILNPAFAETDKGSYKQQDADECLCLLLNIFKNELKNESKEEKFSENLIDELFGISLEIKLSNVEDNTEVKTKQDSTYKLVCYIDNQTSELVTGLKKALEENVDLYSERLCRNTVFVKKQFISRLPPYINVQFNRFFWKQAVEDIPGSKADKAKILKSVLFSKIIDLYDMCTPDVQTVLKLGRDIEAKMLKEDQNYRTDLSCVKQSDNMIPTGRYQLIAVVTHQGRSSDSGHYIGWIHRKDDKWVKFDDDVVSYVKLQDILELKGGGDWHMAYLCIYKSLEVPFQEL